MVGGVVCLPVVVDTVVALGAALEAEKQRAAATKGKIVQHCAIAYSSYL